MDIEVCPTDGLLNLGLMGTNFVYETTKESDSQESDETQLEFSNLSSMDAHTNSEVSVSVVTVMISSTT